MKNIGPIPWLPEGRIVSVPDRGEFFVRHFQHADPSAPTLLLLHGWTASSDVQFFTAYEELAQHYSFVGIDHRGHGRGIRPTRTFSLEECADDAAAVVRALGIKRVITVGYSMGGPISLFVAQRHTELVSAMVLQATSLEWRATKQERALWALMRGASPLLRRLNTPRILQSRLQGMMPKVGAVRSYVPWLIGEIRRNDTFIVSKAGEALSKYDARPWAGQMKKPTAYVLTTNDQLVKTEKQQQLIETLNAQVITLEGDHFVTLGRPEAYSAATRAAVQLVEQHAR
jgi:pimeloyl-ACP methyl ester carboxylesterase